MQKLLKLPGVVLLAALAFGGCKKAKDDTEVTLVNRAAQELTFDVYKSMEDYAAGAAPVLRKVLPPSNKIVLPAGTLAMGSTYYVDWYNEDFTLHNWYNDAYPNGQTTVQFNPKAGDNTYYTSAAASGARQVFLNGSGTTTGWIAIDAFQYSTATGYVSVWNQVPDSERYHSMTVNKNFSAAHEYKAADGSIKTESGLRFKVHVAPQGYIEMYDGNGSNVGYMIAGRLPYSTAPNYASNSTDSVLAMLPNSQLQFLMIKKK